LNVQKTGKDGRHVLAPAGSHHRLAILALPDALGMPAVKQAQAS
jgi:hypothetical protein